MTPRAHQQGATLIVALIFLVLMSLFAISAFNSTSTNLRIVSNTEARQESLSAANLAIEQTISSSLFFTNPSGVANTPITVDIDGNGTADYTAMMTPQPECTRVKELLAAEIPPAPKDDSAVDAYAACRSSTASQGGIFIDGTVSTVTGVNPNACANSEWNVSAAVSDARTSTKVAVNQGINVVILGSDANSFCN